MQIPSKVGTSPDIFRVTMDRDFNGLELQERFNGQTPTSVYRVSIIFADSTLKDVGIDIVILDIKDPTFKFIHKREHGTGFYSWDDIPIIIGPGQFIGVETDGLEKSTSGTLKFKTMTSAFTVGKTLTGASSGATAKITAITTLGANGVLTLSDISKSFTDNEDIADNATGAAKADGIQIYANGGTLEMIASSITGK